ncbi:hypothetical protein ABXN37_23805 [Piscinibacter sakaiensis]|uniref:hypothetical protein n=1 Tax=Piscinibacter sakaiensis TaxID=1547922 RepID=UPI0037296D36
MPLLGTAALLLSFDVAPEVVAEHDRWHTQEHLPERLAIPGFLRGTRWVAVAGGPRYLVLYEVADLAVLAGPDYLARLNAPSPWTQALMPHYRGMRRGLCRVRASVGPGLGGEALLLLPDRGAVLSEPVRYRGAYLLEAAGRAPAAGAAASPA